MPLPGSFLWDFKGAPGLQLRDLTGNGLQDIICETSDGASEGAYLRVFRIYEQRLVLLGPLDAAGYRFNFVDRKLVLYGKWTEARFATVQVLRWNGSRLIYDPRQAATLLRNRISDEENRALAQTPRPPEIRVAESRPLMDILLNQVDYKGALVFGMNLLGVLNTPAYNVVLARQPNALKAMGIHQPSDLAEVDRLHALSAVHNMLAEVYGKMGNQAKQDQKVGMAEMLRSQAATKMNEAAGSNISTDSE